MSSAADPPKTSGTEATGVWSAVGQPLWRDLTGATLGDFFIERILGRGGMGDVYLARQVSLNRPVAIKVLRPELSAKPTYLGRFETEAA
ncbi:MAG: serine/threonine protein kinase, partial [Planctomycetota bacterium]|nr:serine/threonine protein kinase [Planctomycetota bacterium]